MRSEVPSLGITTIFMVYHFSLLLNFKMPGVPMGGIWSSKFTFRTFFDYAVILSWSAALEIFGSEFPLFGRISEATCRRSTNLVSKCSEGSIFYSRSRAHQNLSDAKKS